MNPFRHLPEGWRPLALAVFMLCVSATAQTPEDVRIALVIGNSAYTGAPVLANPAKDAVAMAATLKTLGFTVVELRDGSGAQMAQGLARVRDALRGKQGIGMLYYAGHGLQVEFRNYMVPVDAVLQTAADVPKRAMDLGQVIDAFKAAGTRMNIVVLDACRDNPFPSAASGRGLAPMDAPSGTFLAYATAPGNVADDGDPAAGNGLYTGYLVRELQRPATQIEDVFKRVRLQVRQKSNGRQIPWESTSLEDQFSFNDGAKYTFRPADLQRLDEASRQRVLALQNELQHAKEQERQRVISAALERERATEADRKRDQEQAAAEARERDRLRQLAQVLAADEAFAAEKTDWDRVKNSRNPDDFYEFLRKYPSGKISELASAAMERRAASQLRPVADKDGMVQVPARERFQLGDSWSYTVTDDLTKAVTSRPTVRVARVTEDTVEFSDGKTVYTREGGTIRNSFIPNFDPPRLDLPAGDYAVGKKWTFRSIQSHLTGGAGWVEGEVRIVALEEVTVPAGTFKAYRLELNTVTEWGERGRLVRWMQPEWGFFIKQLRQIRRPKGQDSMETWEMTGRQRMKG